jgi:hypothetical protein
MAISDKAKQKSIDLLEVSISSLRMALGVSAEELTSDYEIPVGEDHLDYKAYVSLVSMHNNLQSLLA